MTRPAPKSDPDPSPRRWLRLRRFGLLSGLCALTVGLLTLSFPPLDLWPLAYVALVPWLWALHATRSRRGALLLSLATGLAFWLVSVHWLWWITLVGYFATAAVLGLLWLAGGLTLTAAIRRRWPMWIVLPVVWVALEYLRAHILSGFPWFFLAHSQYARIPLIQIADVTGQYGVSFFVAMVNGALFDVLGVLVARRQGRRQDGGWRRVAVGPVACAVVCAGLLGYGAFRLSQAERTTAPGPRIGVVQHAYPIALYARGVPQSAIFDQHIESTRLLPGDSLDLVVWPETMLTDYLNPQFTRLEVSSLSDSEIRTLAVSLFGPADADREPIQVLRRVLAHVTGRGREDARRMALLSERMRAPILAGGGTLHRNPQPIDRTDHWVRRNSAMWFTPEGASESVYSKMHLVPFSEYVPFKRSWTALHRALRWFVPPVMRQLEPGRKPLRFRLAPESQTGLTYNLATPICYEGTFARVCRKLVMAGGGKAENTILLNLSNDGWFVRNRGGRWRGTTEQSQHLVHYVFRAVESRVPVVRAVNTGISGSIDSSGETQATIRRGGERTMVEGLLSLGGGAGENSAISRGPRVLVDRRVSLYSLAGDMFAQVVSLAAIGLMIALAAGRRRRRSSSEGIRTVRKKPVAAMLVVVVTAGLLTGCQGLGLSDEKTYDPTPAARQARTTLTRVATRRASDALPGNGTNTVRDENAVARANAMEAMADVMPEQAGPYLMRGLSDPMPVVRFAAALGVGDIQYAPVEDKLMQMAEDKQAEPDKRVLAAVVYALYRLGISEPASVLADLLEDPEAEVVADAAMVMGKMQTPAAIPPLRSIYGEHHDPKVKLQITESLAQLGDRRFAAKLRGYAKLPVPDMRLAAIRALGRTATPQSRRVLLMIMEDDEELPPPRIAAAGSLARLGLPTLAGYKLSLKAVRSAEEMLADAYDREPAPVEIFSVQQIGAITLGWMGEEVAVRALRPLLDSPSGSVRVAAAMSILRLAGVPERVPPPPSETIESPTTEPAEANIPVEELQAPQEESPTDQAGETPRQDVETLETLPTRSPGSDVEPEESQRDRRPKLERAGPRD